MASDGTDLIRQFPNSEPFWEQQQQIADMAWELTAQGLPWPPTSLAEWWQLTKTGLASFLGNLKLLPYALGTVNGWLQRHQLADDLAFKRFIDAQLLISAQTTADNANALYGATALDLARQGVYHVEGGIGGLARTLAHKLEALGGKILYWQQVTRIQVERGQVTGVYAAKGRHSQQEIFFPADFLVANLTPWSLDQLLGEDSPRRLQHEVNRRATGWGAFVLHLGVQANKLPSDIPDHHQIITDMQGSLGEGRSIFVSMSPEWDASRAPAGQRAVTVSTHTAVQPWWDLLERDPQAYAARKETYTETMLNAVETAIPGFRSGLSLVMAGSPVTYNFYTGRHRGMVGGFPQLSLFKARGPRTGLSNARLVGDSIFPGQSTAGVTVGAMRVAADVMRQLPRLSHAYQNRRQLAHE